MALHVPERRQSARRTFRKIRNITRTTYTKGYSKSMPDGLCGTLLSEKDTSEVQPLTSLRHHPGDCTVTARGLFHHSPGTVPSQPGECAVTARGLFHHSPGTVLSQPGDCSITARGLFHHSPGTVPSQPGDCAITARCLHHHSPGTAITAGSVAVCPPPPLRRPVPAEPHVAGRRPAARQSSWRASWRRRLQVPGGGRPARRCCTAGSGYSRCPRERSGRARSDGSAPARPGPVHHGCYRPDRAQRGRPPPPAANGPARSRHTHLHALMTDILSGLFGRRATRHRAAPSTAGHRRASQRDRDL